MGENADQTRDEIVKLRQEMSQKIAGLRKAAERPVRLAKIAAAGTVAVIVVGGVALVVLRARRRAEERSLRGRAKLAADAVSHPQKTAKEARKAADEVRDRLRGELRKQVTGQAKDTRPLHERILTTAAKSAASAAVPIVLQKLQERTAPAGAGGRK
jgi:hypothetical protein